MARQMCDGILEPACFNERRKANIISFQVAWSIRISDRYLCERSDAYSERTMNLRYRKLRTIGMSIPRRPPDLIGHGAQVKSVRTKAQPSRDSPGNDIADGGS